MRGFLWQARDNHKVGTGAAVQKNLVAFLMDTNCSNLIRNRHKSGAKYFDRSAVDPLGHRHGHWQWGHGRQAGRWVMTLIISHKICPTCLCSRALDRIFRYYGHIVDRV